MLFPFYKFRCPECKNPFEFHSRLSGDTVKCPSCGKKIKIPSPENAEGKNTWGNWSKGIFLATSFLIALFLLGLLVYFFHGF
jgi:putative FmdB family regulatory protein